MGERWERVCALGRFLGGGGDGTGQEMAQDGKWHVMGDGYDGRWQAMGDGR